MKKVDYDKISREYDKHRSVGGPYMPQLVELARRCRARDVLELGCGTGNCTAAFLQANPCRIIALDPSPGMLEKARQKSLQGVQWVRGSALAVPLAAESVQFAYGVFFLHHISDLAGVARECARVVGHGAAAFVTASTDFIRNHPMNKYFPSLCEVDLARFRTADDIAVELKKAGFTETGAGTHKAYQTQVVDEAFVKKVEAKYISTYELIPPKEFEQGLARLRADVAQMGKLPEEIQWEWSSVWAIK